MSILKKYGLNLSIIGLWCGITLFLLFNHSPWYDEAHAWNIAQSLNLIDVLRFMNNEGHTFLWYLFIMPFAKLNIGYPYSMLLINWFFAFVAILVLWFKSPFQTWLKLLITFTFPLLQYYPVVARCYAIGIMFLFLVASFEQEKIKRPNLYAFLLVALANTSVVALFPATILGAQFVYELIKNKIKNIVPYVILLTGCWLILFQLCIPFLMSKSAINANVHFFISEQFLSFFAYCKEIFFNNNVFSLVVVCILIAFLIIFYLRNRIFPTMLVFSTACFVIMFCFIYRGFFWHKFFIYMYFIVSIWIIFNKHKNLKLKFVPIAVLSIISVIFIFWQPSDYMYNKVYNNNSEYIANRILKDENLKSAQLVGVGYLPDTIGAFLTKGNIDIKILCSGLSYKQYHKHWFFCREVFPEYKYLDAYYKRNNNTYIVLYEDILKLNNSVYIYSPDKKDCYKLILYMSLLDSSIYKIEKQK